jgi:cyclopropane-fatty-acyl-phospholipid synthase
METNICRDDEMSAIKKDDWTTEDWAKKLKQQADESKEYRHRLYEKVDLKNKRRILDVGCGTGAVTMDIALLTKGEVIGIDIDGEKLQRAERLLSDINNTKVMKANVLDLPFENETFDIVMCEILPAINGWASYVDTNLSKDACMTA